MFIDEAEIHVEGGRGGDGCVSFRREKYRPKGGPDGGDGGSGGAVLLQALSGKSTLGEFHRKHYFRAKGGTRGGPQNRTGRRAADLIIVLPVGTVIKNSDGEVLADLAENGQTFVAVVGGRGGRGNASLVGEAGPLPRFAEKGEPGETGTLKLELKLVADVAIVGFPNAGKSSMISRISRANPRIADYPFTTTEPNLGVVVGEDFDYVVTDVPGLVKGAHSGKGMGDAFLRHIERAAVIMYMVDMSPMSGRRPVDDLVILESELELFNPELTRRRRLVAANKMDLKPDVGEIDELNAECEKRQLPLFCVSAVTGEGLASLLGALGGLVLEERSEVTPTGPAVEYTGGEDAESIEVIRVENRFVVKGKRIERMVMMTDWNNDDARIYLARRLRAAGVEELLEREGADRGDEVEIAGRVFEYIPSAAQDEISAHEAEDDCGGME